MESAGRTLVCSVLFLDIAEYSQKPVAEQLQLKQAFNLVLGKALDEVPARDRIILDTGDGAAVTFMGDPEDALFAAMSRNRTLQTSVRLELSIFLEDAAECGSRAATRLFYAHAGLRPAIRCDEEDARALAGSREYHPLGNPEFHLPRREIRDDYRQAPFELFRRIRRLDAREYRASTTAQVEGQAQELVRAFDQLGAHDFRDTEVELAEIVD